MGLRSHDYEKWGDGAENNILYITGLPGSGKTTLAYGMCEDGVIVISLDRLFRRNLTGKQINDYIWYMNECRLIGGNRVIIEGFQLLDPELCGIDISDKPYILIEERPIKCLRRIIRRESLFGRNISRLWATLKWFLYTYACKRKFVREARKKHSIL